MVVQAGVLVPWMVPVVSKALIPAVPVESVGLKSTCRQGSVQAKSCKGRVRGAFFVCVAVLWHGELDILQLMSAGLLSEVG